VPGAIEIASSMVFPKYLPLHPQLSETAGADGEISSEVHIGLDFVLLNPVVHDD
jgi:hypothetical protein